MSFGIKKQHFTCRSRDYHAMNEQKPKLRTKAITIRIRTTLHDKLQEAADANDWTVNDEINFRLRAEPILEQIRALHAEIAELKKRLPPAE